MSKDTLKIRCGTLNICTYTNKQEEIIHIMENRNIDIMGLAETRHKGEDSHKDLGGGFILAYCGVKEGKRKHGVAVIVGPKVSKYLQEVKLISERLMYCVLKINNRKIIIYQVYAPQQGHSEEVKQEFLELLEENYELNEETITIMMGDFNSRIGKDREGIETYMGPFGEETLNEEGKNLRFLCKE